MYHYAALAWEARPTLKQLTFLRQYLALPIVCQGCDLDVGQIMYPIIPKLMYTNLKIMYTF